MAVLTEVVSAGTLLVSIAALVATAMGGEPAPHRLVRVRRGCAGAAALLVAGSPFGLVTGVALGVACVALLLALHSIWLAMRRPAPLRTCLDQLAAGGDAAWRDQFERPFAEYVRSGSIRQSARRWRTSPSRRSASRR